MLGSDVQIVVHPEHPERAVDYIKDSRNQREREAVGCNPGGRPFTDFCELDLKNANQGLDSSTTYRD